MKPGQAVIHFLQPEALSERAAFAVLSDEERLRAERFRSNVDRTRWSSFRAQMRTILGATLALNPSDVPIVLSEQGKPRLAPPHAGLHFNLSHCSDLRKRLPRHCNVEFDRYSLLSAGLPMVEKDLACIHRQKTAQNLCCRLRASQFLNILLSVQKLKDFRILFWPSTI